MYAFAIIICIDSVVLIDFYIIAVRKVNLDSMLYNSDYDRHLYF